MKTWRIRLVSRDGTPVRMRHAITRYLLSWMWILPGLALAWLVQAKAWSLVLIPTANLVLWALAVFLDPERQFLHDRVAGTRIVKVPVVTKV